MKIQTEQIKSVADQKTILDQKLQDAFREAGWLTKKGNIKKEVVCRKKNIHIENIQYMFGRWENNMDVVLLNLKFDVHFQTEKEEAINHKSTFWAVDADKRYNIEELGRGLNRMMFRIQNQMVFSDKIDHNLYNFWNLDKQGWIITKTNCKTK